MKNKEYSRRKFIRKCLGTGSTFLVGGALILSSCESKKSPQGNKKETSTNSSCDDLSGVSKSEIEKRQKFAYVDKSPVPGNFCGNCSLYVPQTDNAACGGCMLFKGPVCSAGHCIQFVAKE